MSLQGVHVVFFQGSSGPSHIDDGTELGSSVAVKAEVIQYSVTVKERTVRFHHNHLLSSHFHT